MMTHDDTKDQGDVAESSQIQVAKISRSAIIAAALIAAVGSLAGSYFLGLRGKQSAEKDKAGLQSRVATLSSENSVLADRLESLEGQMENLRESRDTDTARLVASARGNIAKTQAIQELLDTGVATPPGEVASGSGGPRARPRTGGAMSQTVNAGTKHGAEGYSFVFDRCVRAGSRVTCHFQVTNEKKDRVLQTFAGYERRDALQNSYTANMTRLFDDLGNEYTAKQAVLGTSESKFGRCTGNLTSIGTCTTKTMITGISIPASFVFDGVTDEATHISLLQIGFQGLGDYLNFKIRNVEFTE